MVTDVADKAVKTEEDVKTAMGTLSGSDEFVKLTILRSKWISSLKTSADSTPAKSPTPSANSPSSLSFQTYVSPFGGSSPPSLSFSTFGVPTNTATSPSANVSPFGAAPATNICFGGVSTNTATSPSANVSPFGAAPATSISFGGVSTNSAISPLANVAAVTAANTAFRTQQFVNPFGTHLGNNAPFGGLNTALNASPSPTSSAPTVSLSSASPGFGATPTAFSFATPTGSLSFVSQTVRDQSSSFKVPSSKDSSRTDKDQRKSKSTNVKKKASSNSTNEKITFKRSVSVLETTIIDRASLEFYRLGLNQRLFMATQKANLTEVVNSLEDGADLDSVKEGSFKQETAWRLAIATGDPSLLKVILRYTPPYKLNTPVNYAQGMTPLMIFAASGSLDCIRYTYLYQYKPPQLSL